MHRKISALQLKKVYIEKDRFMMDFWCVHITDFCCFMLRLNFDIVKTNASSVCELSTVCLSAQMFV